MWLHRGEKCFFERSDKPTLEEGNESKIVFSQADAQPSSLILHPPYEVWGYDGNQLTPGVVSLCYMSPNAWCAWYCYGIKIKEGNKNCCLPISSPGSYGVEVHGGEQKKTSEPVLVSNLNDPSSDMNCLVCNQRLVWPYMELKIRIWLGWKERYLSLNCLCPSLRCYKGSIVFVNLHIRRGTYLDRSVSKQRWRRMPRFHDGKFPY